MNWKSFGTATLCALIFLSAVVGIAWVFVAGQRYFTAAEQMAIFVVAVSLMIGALIGWLDGN